MIRIMLLATLLSLTLTPGMTVANETNLTRQQIRSMPMVQRPDRPGHFVGNTVRALARRR